MHIALVVGPEHEMVQGMEAKATRLRAGARAARARRDGGTREGKTGRKGENNAGTTDASAACFVLRAYQLGTVP